MCLVVSFVVIGSELMRVQIHYLSVAYSWIISDMKSTSKMKLIFDHLAIPVG